MRTILARWYASDVGYSFRSSPTALGAAAIAFICVFCAIFAGWVAPHDPFDLTTLVLSDARLPPAWSDGGSSRYLLGTDDQGRDILSAVIYGARISLAVGVTSVILSMIIGVGLGIYMGAANDFQLSPVHAHVNLVGWASLALFGLAYRAYPELAARKVARFHLILSGTGAVLLPIGIALAVLRHVLGLAILAAFLWLAGALLFLIQLLSLRGEPVRTAAVSLFSLRASVLAMGCCSSNAGHRFHGQGRNVICVSRR